MSVKYQIVYRYGPGFDWMVHGRATSKLHEKMAGHVIKPEGVIELAREVIQSQVFRYNDSAQVDLIEIKEKTILRMNKNEPKRNTN